MRNPRVSVITTSLNSEQTISACIESVADQTYTNTEHIVIDGLSDDRTIQIIENCKTKYSRLSYLSEKDTGVYNAMNKGISVSSGEWILFLGSDDILYDKNVLSNVFSSPGTDNKKFIYGNVKIVGNSGWAKNGDIYGGRFDIKKILNKNICQQSIFYHRDLFEEIGLFNEKYKVCADWDFNIHCFAKYETLFVDIIVANFFGGGVSFSTEDFNFSNDLPANVIKYFGLNEKDPVLMSRKSPFYNIILQSQKSKYPLEYFFYLVKQRLKTIF